MMQAVILNLELVATKTSWFFDPTNPKAKGIKDPTEEEKK